MTEDEAKTKWCPFARVASPMLSDEKNWFAVASANRAALSDRVEMKGVTSAHNPESARCIGSECMAWRWHWSPEKIAGAVEGSLLASRMPDGFCGLAGKP